MEIATGSTSLMLRILTFGSLDVERALMSMQGDGKRKILDPSINF
jgi:hypothetical protein